MKEKVKYKQGDRVEVFDTKWRKGIIIRVCYEDIEVRVKLNDGNEFCYPVKNVRKPIKP